MKSAFLRAVLARRAAIKQRWRVTLENAPLLTPLANPDMLAYMMDDTLDELLLAIRYPKAASRCSEHKITLALAKAGSGCGLNPYIGYFLAGEDALVSVIRSLKPHARLSENDIRKAELELLFALRIFSHRETNAFCDVCRMAHPSGLGGANPLCLARVPSEEMHSQNSAADFAPPKMKELRPALAYSDLQ